MAKHAIDELAVQITASTERLAADLRRADSLLKQFARSANSTAAGAGALGDAPGIRRAADQMRGLNTAARAAAVATALPFYAAARAAEATRHVITRPFDAMKSSIHATGDAARGVFGRIRDAGRDALGKIAQDAKGLGRVLADPLGSAASGLRAAGRKIDGSGGLGGAALAGLLAGRVARGAAGAAPVAGLGAAAPAAVAAPAPAAPKGDPAAEIAAAQARVDAAVKAQMERFERRSRAQAKRAAAARRGESAPGVEIPADLAGLSYRELQGLAKKVGVRAKQPAEKLREQLEAARPDTSAAALAGRESKLAANRGRARARAEAKAKAKESAALDAAFDGFKPGDSRGAAGLVLGAVRSKGGDALSALLAHKPARPSPPGPIQTLDEVGRKTRPAAPPAPPAPAAAGPIAGRGAAGQGGGWVGGWGRTAAVAGGVAGAVGAGFAVGEVRDAVNMAADFEQTSLAFEVMLKSADGARKMLAEVRQFASTTPFNTRELTESARMLTAYGTSADQVVPTLRMLGDVSAAMGKDLPIRDLTYLYGTLQAQGRAYTKDINQFTNRGIDILPELSRELKVSTSEVMRLVEEGRVGFPQVVRAFKAMTSEGGRFSDMTRRQSQTFAGVREAALDAWGLFKQKLGQAVIEETGLKQAARDFDAFAKMLEGHVDRARPFLRFMGDLTKAAVQVAYEFGRAGVAAAQILGAQAAAAFPGLKELPGAIRDLAGMKIDRVKLFDVVSGFGEVALAGVGVMVDALAGFVRAFEITARKIGDAIDALASAARRATDAPGDALGWFARNWTGLNTDPAVRKHMAEQAAKRAADQAGPGRPGALDPVKDFFDLVRSTAGAATKDMRAKLIAEQHADEIDRIHAETVARSAQMHRERQTAGHLGGVLGGAFGPGMSPLAALGASAAQRDLDRYAGYNTSLFRRIIDAVRPGEVRVPGGPDATITAFANQVKDELDPTRKLLQEKADLDRALGFNLITRAQRDAAWTKRVQGAAGHLGIGGEAQLSEAVMVGSQEDARLLTRHATGTGAQKTEDLLQQVIQAIERGNKIAADGNRKGFRLLGIDF